MKQRRMDGMNDVAFGNWRVDYGNFMRQLQPEQTRGWWRLGSQAELFGRFARGWANPSNASAVLPLALDRGLWGGLPLAEMGPEISSLNHTAGVQFSRAPPPSLTIRLVFLDEGKGSFSVGYDAIDEPRMLARVVKTDVTSQAIQRIYDCTLFSEMDCL